MIYRIEETTSTNDDAKRPEYGHDDIIWAERQTAGRGQRGPGAEEEAGQVPPPGAVLHLRGTPVFRSPDPRAPENGERFGP